MRKRILAALSISMLCFAAQTHATPRSMRAKCFTSMDYYYKLAYSAANCATIRKSMNGLLRYASKPGRCQARAHKFHTQVRRRYIRLCSRPSRCLRLVRIYYARSLRAGSCAELRSAMDGLRRLVRSGPRRCRGLANRRLMHLRKTKYQRLCQLRPQGSGGKRSNPR